MVWLVLAAVLTANPEDGTAILVSRRTGFTQAEGDVLSREVSAALVKLDVKVRLDADGARAAISSLGLRDAAACNGRKLCVTELGRQLSAKWILSISLARVGDDRSIALELLQVSDGAVLQKDALILAPKANIAPEQLSAFAGRIRPVIDPAPVPVSDAPVVKNDPPPLVAPVVVTPPIVTLPPPVPPRSHTPQIALGVGAAAALIAGSALAIAGAVGHADAYRVEAVNGERRSPYPASEVRVRAETSAVELGIGGALGAVAIGLGSAAVITW